MDALAIGKPQQPNPFAAVGGGAAVSTGVRQALALVHGAIETGKVVRREAQFVERRVPPPFAGDRIDIHAGEGAGEEPEPTPDHTEIRKLSLTGLPAVEKAEASPRGALVDIET